MLLAESKQENLPMLYGDAWMQIIGETCLLCVIFFTYQEYSPMLPVERMQASWPELYGE